LSNLTATLAHRVFIVSNAPRTNLVTLKLNLNSTTPSPRSSSAATFHPLPPAIGQPQRGCLPKPRQARFSLCTSRPMNRAGPLRVADGRSRRSAVGGAAGLGRGERIDFCGSTGWEWRSMYVFMVFAFHSFVVWGVSPTTGGSAPFTRCNPRLHRRADTAFPFIASHTV